MTPVSAIHPQQTAKTPSEDILAVARALAKLHARLDHEAETARLGAKEAARG